MGTAATELSRGFLIYCTVHSDREQPQEATAAQPQETRTAANRLLRMGEQPQESQAHAQRLAAVRVRRGRDISTREIIL
jgi:hypothetical protein